jgi:nitrogen-specific signal transduction histidine kinase
MTTLRELFQWDGEDAAAILGALAGEMASPISAIQGSANLLLQHLDGKLPDLTQEQFRTFLLMIITKADHLEEIRRMMRKEFDAKYITSSSE